MMGCSIWSWVPVLAQEQLQLSEQQCDAMHAAHAAVSAQLREWHEARKVLSTRLQVRAGSMQLSYSGLLSPQEMLSACQKHRLSRCQTVAHLFRLVRMCKAPGRMQASNVCCMAAGAAPA